MPKLATTPPPPQSSCLGRRVSTVVCSKLARKPKAQARTTSSNAAISSKRNRIWIGWFIRPCSTLGGENPLAPWSRSPVSPLLFSQSPRIDELLRRDQRVRKISPFLLTIPLDKKPLGRSSRGRLRQAPKSLKE